VWPGAHRLLDSPSREAEFTIEAPITVAFGMLTSSLRGVCSGHQAGLVPERLPTTPLISTRSPSREARKVRQHQGPLMMLVATGTLGSQELARHTQHRPAPRKAPAVGSPAVGKGHSDSHRVMKMPKSLAVGRAHSG